MPVLALALALALTGCATTRVAFEQSTRKLDSDSAKAILAATDTSALSRKPVADSPKLRHDALASLRADGDAQARVADLITRVFPVDTRAVPARVLTATWDGTPVVVVVEAWGRPSGSLEQKRLWVLDAVSGEVRFATASR